MVEAIERASTEPPVLTPRQRRALTQSHNQAAWNQYAANTTPLYWSTNQSQANYVSAASLLTSNKAQG